MSEPNKEVTVRLILTHGYKDLKGTAEFVCQEIERLTMFERSMKIDEFRISDLPVLDLDSIQPPLFVGYDD